MRLSANRKNIYQRTLANLALVALCLQMTLQATVVQASPNHLPSLGDSSSSLISPQLEKRIGESFLKQINAALPTVNDPLMKYYVSAQLTNLAQHSELRDAIMSVVVIDNPGDAYVREALERILTK